jgi:hypothetical protein
LQLNHELNIFMRNFLNQWSLPHYFGFVRSSVKRRVSMHDPEMPNPMNEAEAASAADRRKFLAACGKFAVVTPPAITMLLSTSLNSTAIAQSGGRGHDGRRDNDHDDRDEGRHRGKDHDD